MKRYNGANQVRLSKCNVAGLYIVYRRQRRQRGWEEYVRVILAGSYFYFFIYYIACDL